MQCNDTQEYLFGWWREQLRTYLIFHLRKFISLSLIDLFSLFAFFLNCMNLLRMKEFSCVCYILYFIMLRNLLQVITCKLQNYSPLREILLFSIYSSHCFPQTFPFHIHPSFVQVKWLKLRIWIRII